MPRAPRIKVTGSDAYYHITAHVLGTDDFYPFSNPIESKKILDLIRLYTSVYCCEVISHNIMGNHYHLELHFQAFRKMSQPELRRRAEIIYRDPDQKLRQKKDWARFNERIFDLSELMRNIQSAFTRWYNARHDRSGPLWKDRFHSTLITNRQSVQETLYYIELNPVRNKLAERPESWPWGSAFQRHNGTDSWLMPLRKLFDEPDPEQLFQLYRSSLYYRGLVGSRKEAGALSVEMYEDELRQLVELRGAYLERLPHFSRGLVLGSPASVIEWIDILTEKGHYRRPRKPIPQMGGIHHTLNRLRSV